MTTSLPLGSLPTSQRAGAPAGGSPAQVVEAVRQMYRRHPFPPRQRAHTYRHHAAFVRRFLEGRGIDPAGRQFGDMACGTGLMLTDYAKEFPEASFVGYDVSERSVELANQALEEAGARNARACLQDLTALEVVGEFDYIVSWGTVHHLPSPEAGLAAICRALKPGGILRLGVYGYYGNIERRVQQELARTVAPASDDPADDEARIAAVRVLAEGDRNFKSYYTAPPVDLSDDDWVVDEFLHVFEQHLHLRDVVSWLAAQQMQVCCLTDYYDEPIPLELAAHSTSAAFVAMAERLPFADRCHVIEMIARPYWLSVLAERTGG